MADTTTSESSDATVRGGRWWPMAVLGLLLTLSGPVAYMFTLEQPFLRRTGALMWVMMGAGAVVTTLAARGAGKRIAWAPAVFSLGMVALSLYGFYGYAALPADQRFESLASAPDFVLPDQDDKPVALEDLRKGGRVLLVFARGHW